MPPKKKGAPKGAKKGGKSELEKTLEALDIEEFDEASAANVTVKDSLSTLIRPSKIKVNLFWQLFFLSIRFFFSNFRFFFKVLIFFKF